jgi:hypothetical protein
MHSFDLSQVSEPAGTEYLRGITVFVHHSPKEITENSEDFYRDEYILQYF